MPGRTNPKYSRLPQVDAQLQNTKSAQVYVFGDGDMAEADEEVVEFEMSQLPSRRTGKSKRKRKKSTNASDASQPLIFERKIEEGDTLQNIAVKYGCQVAQLKRLNNLMNDQEFHARQSIQVPVKRHGLLTEIIAQENQDNGTNMRLMVGPSGDVVVPVTDDYHDDDEEEDGDERRGLLVRTLSIRDAYSSQGKEAQAWLKKMDTDINKIVSSTNTSKHNLDEVTMTLTCKRIQPMSKDNGADFGIRRSSVVTAMIGLVILVPLIIIIFTINHYLSAHMNNSDSDTAPVPAAVPIHKYSTVPATSTVQPIVTTTNSLLSPNPESNT